MKTKWTKKEIETALENALSILKERDNLIIKSGVNERTLTHLLAMYIASEFEGYDVDCEYNRMGVDGKEMTKKIMIPQGMEDTTAVSDTEAKTVFPDIIVHKRDNADNNLLVIEAKKSSNQERQSDFCKLNGFMASQDDGGRGYCFSAFVVFDVNNPEDSSVEVKEKGEQWKYE